MMTRWHQHEAEPFSLPQFLLAAAVGATVSYFLDPDEGRHRRGMARDRLFGGVRRSSWRASRTGRRVASDALGLGQKAIHLLPREVVVPSDAALKSKVETELFRELGVLKGKINVNVEHGVVVLRGELDRAVEISAVEARVRAVAGVTEVENLLHLPYTAPRSA